MDEGSHPGEQEAPSRRAALLAGAVVLLLVLCGLWLAGLLGHAGMLQDCVAAGRSNCAPVATRGS
jgi:hypothetical protein